MPRRAPWLRRNDPDIGGATMHWSELFQSAGALFIVATASAKTMVPLRTLGMAANALLIVYYAAGHVWGAMAIQAIALPLNGWRLLQMRKLVRDVRAAIGGDTSLDWLKPFMTKRRFRKGDILYVRNELADGMFYMLSGRYLLLEFGLERKAGEVVGELGMLVPDHRRSATLECIEDGEALTISYEQVEQLYYQNPQFGFYLLRLATGHLLENVNRLEAELTRLRAAATGHA